MISTKNYMRRTDGKRIPPPSDELLKKMYVDDGLTALAIATQLDFSRRQVQNLILRAGITKRKPPTIAQRLNLTPKAMHDLFVTQGNEAGEIAEMYGEPVLRIRNLLAREGIRCRVFATTTPEPALVTTGQQISQAFLSRRL